jgi:hypothetical protein
VWREPGTARAVGGASSKSASREVVRRPARLSTILAPVLALTVALACRGRSLARVCWAVGVLRRSGESFARGLSPEKLGKLVRDLSLAAMLLAELPEWETSLRLLEARTVALR